MKSIYFLLTSSNSYLSRLIHFVTKDEYTHVSISFDEKATKFYSFSRRRKSLPLPAGLVQEEFKIADDVNLLNVPCCMYELKVSTDSYEQAKLLVNQMLNQQHIYRYNVIGLILCAFSIDFQRENHYFCSQFVGKVLTESSITALSKPPGLMRPIDFSFLEESQCVYSGNLRGLVRNSDI